MSPNRRNFVLTGNLGRRIERRCLNLHRKFINNRFCASAVQMLLKKAVNETICSTDRSFQYVSPRLWNQLPAPLRQPCTNLSNSASPSCMSGISSICSIDSKLSSSITPSLFHSRLKTFLPIIAYHFFSWTDSTDSPDCLPILLSISVFSLYSSCSPLLFFLAVD